MSDGTYKTGYVSGFFDGPLSPETVQVLAECRSQCDRLTVGIVSDDLLLRLLDRAPEYPFEMRKAALLQLRCVDGVVEVGWDSIGRQESYGQLHYDVCFHASEYGLAFEEDRKFCSDSGIALLPLPGQKACLFGRSLKFLLENSADRDIVLFGTGKYFERYMRELGKIYPPAYAVDNDRDRQGTVKCGVRIYGTERLKEPSGKKPLVIVCAKNHDPMVRQLKDQGDIDYRTLVCNDGFAVFDEAAVLMKEEESYMGEAHRLLMLLLVEFDRVCRKYGLKYFLQGGSLIGAVRHHALIPWDDDVDVAMFRGDYERLREVAGQEWAEGDFRLVSYDGIGRNVFHDFMTRLVYVKESIPTSALGKSGGRLRPELKDRMVMDIYVLDEASSDDRKHAGQVFRIKALYGLAMGHRVSLDFSDYEGCSSFVKAAVRSLPLLGKLLPLPLIFRLYERTCRRYRRNNDSGTVYEVNSPLCNLNLRIGRFLFGNGTCLDVSGHEIMVPEHYAEYLEMHGYRNFMQYPPGNVRKPTHWVKTPGVKYTL